MDHRQTACAAAGADTVPACRGTCREPPRCPRAKLPSCRGRRDTGGLRVAWLDGTARWQVPYGSGTVMAEFTYAEALRALAQDASVNLSRLLAAACPPGWHPVVYLADYSRQVLCPLTPEVSEEQVDGTPAGRAFTTGQPAVSAGDGHARVWVPVLEQTSRVGVLGVSLPEPDRDGIRQAELLGVFAGTVVAGLARVTDVPRVRRHGRRMSLQASMQWDLLPPWAIRVPGAVIGGMLEPAYDVAGDAYDYAADGGVLHFALVDGMGHGLRSALLAGLTVGAYRHARRAGDSIRQIHVAVDRALADAYGDLSFATGIIGTLTVATGRLEWTCAGHPPPLLLRGGKVAGELECEPTLPFGLGTGTPPVSCRDLRPGDSVFLYTDGVTDAHAPGGDLFGVGRLSGLLEREAAGTRQPEELLRRLVRELLGHQGGRLRDDATVLLLRWTGA